MESCPVDEIIHLSARLDEITYGAAWTHKIHEKQADIYELIGKALSLISIVTVAASGSGAIASIVVDDYALKCVVAALSAVSLFCALWAKSFRFDERASSQRSAAKRFLEIRELAKELSLRIVMKRLDVDSALEEIDALVERYLSVCVEAPSTTGLAVRIAGRDLSSEREAS